MSTRLRPATRRPQPASECDAGQGEANRQKASEADERPYPPVGRVCANRRDRVRRCLHEVAALRMRLGCKTPKAALTRD